MIRRALWSLGLASMLSTLAGCPSPETPGSETEADTEGSSDSGGTGDSTTTGVDSTGDSTDGTTGEQSGVELTPCDPNDEEPCEEGVCAGHPMSGFYCRPRCSSEAEPGTPCGSDDVCLPMAPGSIETACFNITECDFLTGEGCNVEAGDSCVVVGIEPLYTECVPAGDAGAGQACQPAGMLECGSGLACLGGDVESSSEGECVGWCAPGEALPDDCSACAPLGELVGTCAECSVLGDDCPEGSQCQIANELLGGECVGYGPGFPGSPCSPLDEAQSCQEGLLCADISGAGDFTCLEPCDPASPMCTNEGESCLDLSIIDTETPAGQLGVCLAVGVMLCDPTMEPTTCLPGDNCLDIGGGIGICGAVCDPAAGDMACEGNSACFPSDGTAINTAPFVEGNGACGQSCTTDVECGGGTCLHMDGLDADGLCGATCTPGMGMCGGGETCVATPEDPMVGACMAGGTACNLGNVGECGAGACLPREGDALVGICLPACFSQDPVACGGMPAQCHSKTDPIWHEGTCVGGGEPCSLIDDSCGPGQACGIVGGGPFGGQAFVCDDAGPLGEGGDCSLDNGACGAGVGCIAGTCRAWCDPMAPSCASGTCTDVSLGFYLPVDTIGACL